MTDPESRMAIRVAFGVIVAACGKALAELDKVELAVDVIEGQITVIRDFAGLSGTGERQT